MALGLWHFHLDGAHYFYFVLELTLQSLRNMLSSMNNSAVLHSGKCGTGLTPQAQSREPKSLSEPGRDGAIRAGLQTHTTPCALA